MSRSKTFVGAFPALLLALAGTSAQAAVQTIDAGAVRFILDTGKVSGPWGTPSSESQTTYGPVVGDTGATGSNGGVSVGASPGVGGSGSFTQGYTQGSLVFEPDNFDVVAGSNVSGNAGNSIQVGKLGLRIEVAKDYRITGIHLNEEGFYAALGDDSRVGAFSALTVKDPATRQRLTRASGDATGAGDSSGFWDINLNRALNRQADSLDVKLKNILMAAAGTSGSAFNEKDLAALRVDVAFSQGVNPDGFAPSPIPPSVIPIPASVWLLGSALAGLATIGRRRAVA
jgi:hypothetical protein